MRGEESKREGERKRSRRAETEFKVEDGAARRWGREIFRDPCRGPPRCLGFRSRTYEADSIRHSPRLEVNQNSKAREVPSALPLPSPRVLSPRVGVQGGGASIWRESGFGFGRPREFAHVLRAARVYTQHLDKPQRQLFRSVLTIFAKLISPRSAALRPVRRLLRSPSAFPSSGFPPCNFFNNFLIKFPRLLLFDK